MRYVCMHKVSPNSEAGLIPSQALVHGMGELIGEAARNGVLLGGGGLLPSRMRLRLRFAGGQCTVTEGPLVGQNELPASFVLIKVATRDEAIDWARRYGKAIGAEEIDLGPLTEPWDLGVCPRPENPPLQFMILVKATKASEAGESLAPAQATALASLIAEMVRSGVLTFSETLLPSSHATRLRWRGGKRTVLDGPFTESKEQIGGFCTLQMHSLDELLLWADRFAKIIGEDMEMDLRQAVEPQAKSPANASGR